MVKKHSHEAEQFYAEGQLHLRKGEHEESVKSFTHAMRAGWDPEISFLSRGVANLLAEHPAKAHDDFTEVLGIDDEHTRALFYRGSASMNLGNFTSAADDFTRVLNLDPTYGHAWLNRGVCYAQTGRYDDAAADIKQAIMAAETSAQHFADSMLIWRNHVEGVLGVLHKHTDLTEDDIRKLQEFFET